MKLVVIKGSYDIPKTSVFVGNYGVISDILGVFPACAVETIE